MCDEARQKRACMGTGWWWCVSDVSPCLYCLWDSLLPASRRTLRISTCSARAQPMLVILLGSFHRATCNGFTNLAFPETSINQNNDVAIVVSTLAIFIL